MKKKLKTKGICEMCGVKSFIYRVTIDKGLYNYWCRDCIDDEEGIRQKFLSSPIRWTADNKPSIRGMEDG